MFCSPSTVGGTNHRRFPLTSDVPDAAHFFSSCVCIALTFYNWEETTLAAMHDKAVTPRSHKDSLSCILAAAQSKRDDFQEAHAAEI